MFDILPKNRAALIANGHEEVSQSLIDAIAQSPSVIAIDGGYNFCNRHRIPADLLVGDLDSISPELLAQFSKHKIIKLERAKDLVDLEVGLQTLKKVDASMTPIIFNACWGRMDQHLHNLYVLTRYPESMMATKDFIISVNQIVQDCIGYAFYEGFVIEREGEKIAVAPGNSITFKNSDRRIQGDFLSIQRLGHKKIEVSTLVPMEKIVFPYFGKEEDYYLVSENQPLLNIPTRPGMTLSLIPWHGPAQGIVTSGLKWNLLGHELNSDFVGISNVALESEISIEIEAGELLCIVEKNIIDSEMIELVDSTSTSELTLL